MHEFVIQKLIYNHVILTLIISCTLITSVIFVHYLGNIPLRHLVYRALDLPLSMQQLLYDFGQVTGKTEEEYVHKIVTNHVRMLPYSVYVHKFSCVHMLLCICRCIKTKGSHAILMLVG